MRHGIPIAVASVPVRLFHHGLYLCRCATLSTRFYCCASIVLWLNCEVNSIEDNSRRLHVDSRNFNQLHWRKWITAWLKRQSQSIASTHRHKKNWIIHGRRKEIQMIVSMDADQSGRNIVAIVMPSGNRHSLFFFLHINQKLKWQQWFLYEHKGIAMRM